MSHGKIDLFVGPMFSGKTTAMMSSVNRHMLRGRSCVIIKPTRDTRRELVESHDGMVYKKIPQFTVDTLANFDADKYDVIGVDEGQFFGDIIAADDWARSGKIVVIAYLNGDFLRHEFGPAGALFAKADSITQLHAVCMQCGEDAAFNRRIIANTSIICPGGSESYEPRCRACFDN